MGVICGSFVQVKCSWVVNCHIFMSKDCNSDPIFYMSVFTETLAMHCAHIMLNLPHYSSHCWCWTVLSCSEMYLQWMKARVGVQLQLHQCCYGVGCCRWMCRSDCWTSIRHDAVAESGRGVWSDAPPSYFSLERIVAFQKRDWSHDRWGQVTIWNDSTTNLKWFNSLFIIIIFNKFSEQYNMYNSAVKRLINIILILHIRR